MCKLRFDRRGELNRGCNSLRSERSSFVFQSGTGKSKLSSSLEDPLLRI